MDIDIECQEKKMEENLKKYAKVAGKIVGKIRGKNLRKIKKMWLKCQDDETIMCEGVIRYSYIFKNFKEKGR